MPDTREQILARILAVLTGVRGVNVFRNYDEINEENRPCLVLIDGDEAVSATSTGKNLQPIVMDMTPIIAIGVSNSPEQVGADANALRLKLIPLLLGDAQLAALATPNGRMRYAGLNGKLNQGALPGCDQQLLFTISYPLQPVDLP